MASPHEPQFPPQDQSPPPLVLPADLSAPASFPSVLASPTFDASTPDASLDPLFSKHSDSDTTIPPDLDMHIQQQQPMTVAPMETTTPNAFQSSFMSGDQHTPPLDLSNSGYSSHTSSPSAPGGGNNVFAGMPTSLAHAFNAIMASAPSTGFQNTPSDVAFPSAGGSNLSPPHPSGFHFPPLDLDNRPPARADPTPDVPGGPHVLVLEDILKKCVHVM